MITMVLHLLFIARLSKQQRIVIEIEPECERDSEDCELIEIKEDYETIKLTVSNNACYSHWNQEFDIHFKGEMCEEHHHCCGTCSFRYCCDDRDELDQSKCENYEDSTAEASPDVVDYQQNTTNTTHEGKMCEAYYDKSGVHWPKQECSSPNQHCSGECDNRRCSWHEKELDQTSCPIGSHKHEFCDSYEDHTGRFHHKKHCLVNEHCSGSCNNRHCGHMDTSSRLNQTLCANHHQSKNLLEGGMRNYEYMETFVTPAPQSDRSSNAMVKAITHLYKMNGMYSHLSYRFINANIGLNKLNIVHI